MANLPKAKGALEPIITRDEKKAERITAASAQILTAAISSVTAPIPPPQLPPGLDEREDGEIERGLPANSPSPAPSVEREPASRVDSLKKDLTQEAERYSSEQQRLTQKSLRVRKEEEDRETKNRDTTKSTSVWLPPASKKELLNLQLRMFDYDVQVSLKTLVLYALDKLRLMPDEDVARELKTVNRDKRRKEFRDAQEDGED